MHLRLPVWIIGFVSSLVASCGAASLRHLFADAAFREELLLFLLEPAPHAAIRLMNQRQRYVAEILLAPSLEIRPIVLRIMMMVAELHHLFIARMVFVPHRPAVRTEPILIVLAKLNKAA